MLATGRLVNMDFDIERLAFDGNIAKMFRALQFESRAGGHTRHPYSVLHHTLFGVALYGEEHVDNARAWAIHDLQENITKDIPRPLKCYHFEKMGECFDAGLLNRDDLVLKGQKLQEALLRVKPLDKTIINEEFHFFELPGWDKMPESKVPLRPSVMAAIRRVVCHAKKNGQQMFGAMTDAPRRLSQWLTTSSADCNVEYVLRGLECSERG